MRKKKELRDDKGKMFRDNSGSERQVKPHLEAYRCEHYLC